MGRRMISDEGKRVLLLGVIIYIHLAVCCSGPGEYMQWTLDADAQSR
jgi:hypothetical protein